MNLVTESHVVCVADDCRHRLGQHAQENCRFETKIRLLGFWQVTNDGKQLWYVPAKEEVGDD